METNNTGRKITLLCEKSGLSQEQLAEFLGIERSQIINCEKGICNLSVDLVEKIGNLFNCTLEELTNPEIELNGLTIGAYASIAEDDLIGISEINRIALNLKEMEDLQEKNISKF